MHVEMRAELLKTKRQDISDFSRFRHFESLDAKNFAKNSLDRDGEDLGRVTPSHAIFPHYVRACVGGRASGDPSRRRQFCSWI